MNRGYVKLWRKSQDSGLMQNHGLWVLWCWCLMKASHKETKAMVGNQVIQLNPGEFIFGRKKASEELKMSEKQIRTRMQLLEKLENLAIRRTNKFSVITIINWETYQPNENCEGQQVGNQGANKGPTKGHKQECKEYIEENLEGTVVPSCEEGGGKSPSSPDCPHLQIIELWHEVLPELQRVRVWKGSREENLRARWREDPSRQNLDWWKNFFSYIRKCRFLMGEVAPKPGAEPFRTTLAWVVMPNNFWKIVEGFYER